MYHVKPCLFIPYYKDRLLHSALDSLSQMLGLSKALSVIVNCFSQSHYPTLYELKLQDIKNWDSVVFSRYSRVKCFENDLSIF